MATTISLAAGAVIIIQNSNTHITPIGRVSQGTISQIGDDITEWAVDDNVVYDISNPKSYTIGGVTYSIVSGEDIYLKYSTDEA